jgi:hypothetical protein
MKQQIPSAMPEELSRRPRPPRSYASGDRIRRGQPRARVQLDRSRAVIYIASFHIRCQRAERSREAAERSPGRVVVVRACEALDIKRPRRAYAGGAKVYHVDVAEQRKATGVDPPLGHEGQRNCVGSVAVAESENRQSRRG